MSSKTAAINPRQLYNQATSFIRTQVPGYADSYWKDLSGKNVAGARDNLQNARFNYGPLHAQGVINAKSDLYEEVRKRAKIIVATLSAIGIGAGAMTGVAYGKTEPTPRTDWDDGVKTAGLRAVIDAVVQKITQAAPQKYREYWDNFGGEMASNARHKSNVMTDQLSTWQATSPQDRAMFKMPHITPQEVAAAQTMAGTAEDHRDLARALAGMLIAAGATGAGIGAYELSKPRAE